MDPYQTTVDQFNPSPTSTPNLTSTLDWNTLVVEPLTNLVIQCINFIPDLIAALFIIAFAWLIAKVLEFVTTQFLKTLRFDVIAEKIGLGDLIKTDKEPSVTPSRWGGVIIFWLTICLALVIAFNRLRLSIASKWLDDVVNFSISIFSAGTILILGIFLSEIVARIVGISAQKMGIKHSVIYADVIRYFILFFTLMLTLMQFHVPGQFVLITVGAIFITLCTTFVIAFGFGGRIWAAKILDKLY